MMDESGPESLHERDFAAWTRGASGGAPRGAGASSIGWEQVAEEMKDIRKSETSACESTVRLLAGHALKIRFSADIENERHRRLDAGAGAQRTRMGALSNSLARPRR